MKGKYALKFGLYVLVFLLLWFWYQQQAKTNAENDKIRREKSSKKIIIETDSLFFKPE